jgi:hypothetical protein
LTKKYQKVKTEKKYEEILNFTSLKFVKLVRQLADSDITNFNHFVSISISTIFLLGRFGLKSGIIKMAVKKFSSVKR